MLSDVQRLFDEPAGAPRRDRRLTRRVVDAWARAAKGRFPSFEAMRALDLGDDWDWMFAVDCEKSAGFPYFVYLGDELAKLADVFLCGQADWTCSLLEKATADVFSAVADEAPYFREETLVLCDGRRVLIRCVTAPLADDGERVSHVIGAVNGRFAAGGPLGVV